jgi:hypothetical protein
MNLCCRCVVLHAMCVFAETSLPLGLARLRASGFIDKELREDFAKKSNITYARRVGALLDAGQTDTHITTHACNAS